MSETPIFDEIRAATLLDPDIPAAPPSAPAQPAGPCEDRPPHLLSDDDGVE